MQRMVFDRPHISPIPDVPLLTMDQNRSAADPENKSSFKDWSQRMKTYLSKQGLWDIIEGSSGPEENEIDYETWTKRNDVALHAIRISCDPSAREQIQGISSAKIAWDYLARMEQMHATASHPTDSSVLILCQPSNVTKAPSQTLFSPVGVCSEGRPELGSKPIANFTSNMAVSQDEERRVTMPMLQALKDEVESLREWIKEIDQKLAAWHSIDHHKEPTGGE
ncbi:hypothetical protein K2173_019644 [Erythroxylum novogranatense]|uniref:DUF4219 domain-containing protein n=1 Tax=Erythroxylum novogranatense TaxID=1862640 RepID=A0AAV8UBW7_9ROSI|nr:hypothetical protein K2173_019644 [Erythroxylum novogranatense]